MGYGVKRV